MENPTQMTEERETLTNQDTPEGNGPQNTVPQSTGPEGTAPAQPHNGQPVAAQPDAAQPGTVAAQTPPVPDQPAAHAAAQPPGEPPADTHSVPREPEAQPEQQAAPDQPQPEQQQPKQPAGAEATPPEAAPSEAASPETAQPEPAAEAASAEAPEKTAEETAEDAAAEAAAGAPAPPKAEGSMIGAVQGRDGKPKDPNNPVGRPLSTDFDFMVSDEEFEYMIKHYCRDLTKRCAEGKEDPVIGRDEEVIKMSTILLQRGRSNVVLLAEGGVGKTALFSALAHYFVSPNVPDIYKGARVIDVDLTSMAAGTSSRAEFEGRLKPFLQACTERNEERILGSPIVICLDEVHTTMGSCLASSAAGVADVMKPALTAGNLYVVGATTVEEYNKYCKPDAAYDRRFQKIHLEEPTVADTIHILKGLKKKYADYHQLTISDELIEWHVPVVTKFLRKRMNPDKSIMMLDAACAEALKEGKFGGELTREDCARAIGSEAGVKWEALLGE